MIRKTNENYQPSFLQADLLEQLDEKTSTPDAGQRNTTGLPGEGV
jgi:hypothetical protein